ncbi:ThiJ/PfpI family protein [Trichophyton verrucosum HKI 0517]|uniref:ThiJ/PfpI family protein n=1 Tax=Trichophyton verrucosum (strain HKI 0517) TaxID=663202 RepID=D4D2B8_TRIVH|nr:ThiJ/PfpI family protein [Trichophyton verrucosum HKI 0517]EFE43994.1 ThiJ/PfpI family protein [Trichophyton verrucosum HKI 0517]
MVANDSKTLRIGVLLTHSVQLLDLAAVDLFGMMSKDYISEVDVLPPEIASLGLPVDINYIGIQPNCAGTFIRCTANIGIRLNASIHDTSVSTDSLDILVIPGPDPKYVPDESVLAFVKAHHDAGNDILSICTGSYVAGYAGILDHKNVTGPRGLISDLEVKFPNVKKWDTTRRVVKDGNVWTSGMILPLSDEPNMSPWFGLSVSNPHLNKDQLSNLAG